GDIKWFGQVIASAGCHELLNLPRSRVSTNDNDRDVLRRYLAPQLRKDVPSVQVRQMYVQQNEIGRMFARQIQTEPALHCAQQLDLRLLAKNFLNEIEIGKIVLDVKDGGLAGNEVLVEHGFILTGCQLCG